MKDFMGGFATQEEVAETIRSIFEDTGYLVDTHTAVAARVYEQYRRSSGDETPGVIASTASPYKFAHSVTAAIQGEAAVAGKDEFQVVDELCRISGVPVPAAVEEIRTAPIRHNRECDPGQMKEIVKNILGI